MFFPLNEQVREKRNPSAAESDAAHGPSTAREAAEDKQRLSAMQLSYVRSDKPEVTETKSIWDE